MTFRLRFVVLVRFAKSSLWTNRLYKSCRVCTAIVRNFFPFSSDLSLALDALADGEPAGTEDLLSLIGKLLPDVECEAYCSCHSTLKGLYHGSHLEHLELVPCIGVLSFPI